MKQACAIFQLVILCIITTIVVLFFSWAFFIPRGKREAMIMSYGASKWAKLSTLYLGMKMLISGGENIPDENKGYLSVSNHLSFLDILLLINVLKSSFMAKSSLLYTPFGWGAYIIGAVFINRSNVKDQIKSMYRALEVSKKSISVHVFPEGTRSKDGKILPFKKGLFALAYKRKMPILVCGIWGTQKITPAKQILADFSNPGVIHIHGLIDPKNFSGIDEFFQTCENEVRNSVQKAKNFWENYTGSNKS